MGKEITKIINRFDGGLTEDKRSKSANKYSLVSHFDVFSDPHSLKPQYKTEANENKDYNIVQFCYAPILSAGAYRLYGLGIDSGTKAEVYQLDVDDNIANAWATCDKSASAKSNRNEEVFFYYKNFIYMWAAGQYLTRFDTTNVDVFNDSYYDATSYTYVAQPVHHPSDDIAYFFHDNFVHKLNDTSWSAKVLTLPSNMRISAACPYGDYLAIACVTKGTQNIKSIVLLWDRDSSLTTLTERIDFGLGEIVHLACLDNRLIAIMQQTTSIDSSLDRGVMTVKTINGKFGVILNTLYSDDVVLVPIIAFPKTRFVKDNILYFPMAMPLNGDNRHGIWAVDSSGRLALEYIEEEATSYEGIYFTGNVIWIAHSDDGSVNRSDNGMAYSTTLASIYESLINFGDSDLISSENWKLKCLGVMTEPMPAAGQIILKYRIDGDLDGSWTTIFTHTTDDSLYHEAINIESSGANLPTFKEIQIRIESTGGAVITGFKYKAEHIPKGLSD